MCIQGLNSCWCWLLFCRKHRRGKIIFQYSFCWSHDGCPEWLRGTIACIETWLFSLFNDSLVQVPSQWSLVIVLDAFFCQMNLSEYVNSSRLSGIVLLSYCRYFWYLIIANLVVISSSALCGQFNPVSDAICQSFLFQSFLASNNCPFRLPTKRWLFSSTMLVLIGGDLSKFLPHNYVILFNNFLNISCEYDCRSNAHKIRFQNYFKKFPFSLFPPKLTFPSLLSLRPKGFIVQKRKKTDAGPRQR